MREGRLRISVLHGPNLDRLGTREPEIYGEETLTDIDSALVELAVELGAVDLDIEQHAGEGAYLAAIHRAADEGADGLLLNPAGYTHTSVAIRDAVLGVGLPAVEVHLSNPDAREAFRRHSYLADVVHGRVAGFGKASYLLALRGLVAHLRAGA